jgi:ABC-type nitrate/sulfonate/bicarbonate transport system permease component
MDDDLSKLEQSAKDYINSRFADAEKAALAYADAPKPRWYAVAGFVAGALVGIPVGMLLIHAIAG